VREETTDEHSLDGHLTGPAPHPGDRDGRAERHDLEGAARPAAVAPAGAADAAGGDRALAGGPGPRCAACGRDGASDSSLYRDAFADFGGLLYTLEWIPAAALDRRRRRDIRGDGDFADLRRLLIGEGAR